MHFTLFPASSCLFFFFLFVLLLVSLRNVGQLSGMLSQSYAPKLPECSDSKIRKTYGNGKFKFPRNYEDDERDGVIGYDDSDNDSDNDSDEEGEGEGGDNEYHNIVSLIASEIFEQKKKEKKLFIENENEKFRILQMQNENDLNNEILLAEKEREEIENNYIHEKMKLLEAVVMKEIEDEKIAELLNERNDRNNYNSRNNNNINNNRNRNRSQCDMSDSEGESDIQFNNYNDKEYNSDDNIINREREKSREKRERGRERSREVDDQTPLHFWDSLLRKPLSPQGTDSRLGSKVPAEYPMDGRLNDNNGNFNVMMLISFFSFKKMFFILFYCISFCFTVFH